MKVFKSIMLYLLIAIGVCAAGLLVCCVILMVSPNTSIFGYKYVSYKATHTKELTEYRFTHDIGAISIETNRMSVNIQPHSDNTEYIKIVYKQGMSGFVKKDTKLELEEPKVTAKQFTGVNDDTTYNAIIIKMLEPEGLVFLNNPAMTIYLPANVHYSVIQAETGKGVINFIEAADSSHKIDVSKLYLSSSTSNINIAATGVDDYFITTKTGDLFIANNNQDINANISFNTKTGSFSTASTINGTFNVESSVGSVGPNIKLKKVLGTFNYNAPSGNVVIESIGSEADGKGANVTIKSTNAKFTIGTIYGYTYVQPYNEGNIENLTFNINYLYNISKSGQQSFFESGKGDITIGTLKGYSQFKTSTGDITIKDAWESMLILSYSGTINVAYNLGATINNELGGFQVDTTESYITATNLHCVVDIDVNDAKLTRGRKIDLTFTRIVDNSSINAYQHDVKISAKKGQVYTLITQGTTNVEVNSTVGLHSPYSSTDSDYKSSYEGHKVYRVGYALGSGNSVSKSIDIVTTGNISVVGVD